MNRGILQGLRVLDFTRVMAGPYATRLLADFGAEVIKIQSKKTAFGTESNSSSYFKAWNRNKRSITLDMSYPEAKEIALKLTAVSDIVIENFSARVMSNWGLNYHKLREVKPDIIMVSMSGMGHTGPWRDFVAFGPTIQALSGLTFLTSFSESAPLGLGFSYADAVAGLFSVLAILIALEHRDREGSGQHIDLSEYEALCTLLGPALLDEFANHTDVLPQGNCAGHVQAAPYGCYKCLGEDRWCVIAVSNEAEWRALCNVLGNPSWTNETRFSTLTARMEHASVLDELLEVWTAKHKAGDLVQVLQEAGVPAGMVQDAEDLAKDPQLTARGFFVRLEHPVYGEALSDNSPIKMSPITTKHWKASPLLGEDNRVVFTELLEMKEAELSSYIKRGIVG